MLTRDQILAVSAALPRETVEVPEWGGPVTVRCMTGTDRDRFEILMAKGDRANYRALLVVFTTCDESGKRLFTEADARALGEMPASALDRVATAAVRVSRITAGDVEELAKNSESGPSDAS